MPPSTLAGELGPSTIVGSAAFNLLGISAICVLAIPAGQSRYIKERGVFATTAFFSVFACAARSRLPLAPPARASIVGLLFFAWSLPPPFHAYALSCCLGALLVAAA